MLTKAQAQEGQVLLYPCRPETFAMCPVDCPSFSGRLLVAQD